MNVPHLVRRRKTYEVRIRVPKDLAGAYGNGKQTHVVKSLKTRDLAEATRLHQDAVDEIMARFAKTRAARALTVPPKPFEAAFPYTPGISRAEIVRRHRAARFDDLRLERGEIVARALADPDAFWRGNVIRLPEDDAVRGASYWHHVIGTGELPIEDAVLYALAKDIERRVVALRRQAECANPGDFLSRVPEDRPERDRRLIALDLIDCEIALLEGAKPPIPVEATVIDGGALVDVSDAPTVAKTAPLMSAVFPRFRAEHASIATRVAFIEGLVHDLTALVGDKPINAYTVADARTYKDAMGALPKNWRKLKELRDKTLPEALKAAQGLTFDKPTDVTTREKLGGLRQLFKWLAAEYADSHVKNPFDTVRLPKSRDMADNEAKDPFSTGALDTIFARFATVPKKDAELAWLSVLGHVTGARLNELCQLRADDVGDHDGITFVRFTTRREDGKDGMRLKNGPSIRSVPIHDAALRYRVNGATLADFLKSKRGDAPLFSFTAKPAGKKFSRRIAAWGAKTDTTSFHSFRHNFTAEAQRVGMRDSDRERLEGHALEGMSGRYGQNYRAEAADMELLVTRNEQLQRMKWKALDR